MGLTPFEKYVLKCATAFALSYGAGRVWRRYKAKLTPEPEPTYPFETEQPEVPVGQDPSGNVPDPGFPLVGKPDAPLDGAKPAEPMSPEPVDFDPGFGPDTVGPETGSPGSVDIPVPPCDGGAGLLDPVQSLPSGFESGMAVAGLYGLGAFFLGGAVLVAAMGVASKYGHLDAMNHTSALYRLNDMSQDEG
jgi:hypothetical protein